MARKVLWCVSCVVALAMVGCAASRGESVIKHGYDFWRLDKVAVIEVVGEIGSEAARNSVAHFFSMELLRRRYEPVERLQVQAILEEQEFQRSDLTRPEEAARAGRILNVPAVLVITVSSLGEEISMTAKMIDVEDAGILWMGAGSGRTGRTLSTLTGAVLGAGAGAALGGDSTGRAFGAVAGGVLGGVAGHALSPQQAAQVQKIVKDVCEDLPWRFPVAVP